MVEAVRELPEDDPLAMSASAALHAGDSEELSRLLHEHPYLARCRIVGRRRGTRTLLHVFADWPGHNPNAREVVALLQAAGADVDAPTGGGTSAETALHWAASSDDIELLDALLDAGANIEARGAVIGGGTAIADATAFGQWRAAERLLERGAHANLFESAVMGLNDRVQAELDATPPSEQITHALWGACHGGRQGTASMLIDSGADLDWVGWDDLTPLDVAKRTADERPDTAPLVAWLRAQGARSASEL
jgi:uncharacterized protein